MRYTEFKLTPDDIFPLTVHVEISSSVRYDMLHQLMALQNITPVQVMTRIATMSFLDGALFAMERDGLARFEKFYTEGDPNKKSVTGLYIDGRPVARKAGIHLNGLIVGALCMSETHTNQVMGVLMEVGAKYPEYVSDILYVTYVQIRVAITKLSGHYWSDSNKALAYEQLEAVYSKYLIDPEVKRGAA
jgi:hypothetical protein